MSALAALLAKKRQATEQAYGSRKTVKASALDTAQLSELRKQEEVERAKKVSYAASTVSKYRSCVQTSIAFY